MGNVKKKRMRNFKRVLIVLLLLVLLLVDLVVIQLLLLQRLANKKKKLKDLKVRLNNGWLLLNNFRKLVKMLLLKLPLKLIVLDKNLQHGNKLLKSKFEEEEKLKLNFLTLNPNLTNLIVWFAV